MKKEEKDQIKVCLNVEVVWRALAKDLRLITPKAIPNLVKHVEILEGDGGLGTVLLFTFGPGVPNETYQKEKIVEFDETQYQIGLEVIEGGHLNHGFASYGTFFKLTGNGETETLIDITVVSDAETEETTFQSKTIKSTLFFIKSLEDYLLKNNA